MKDTQPNKMQDIIGDRQVLGKLRYQCHGGPVWAGWAVGEWEHARPY